MDVRGKLVELLGKVQQMGVIYRENQMDERYPTIEQIRNTEVAARLIDNGVTVQEWIPASEPPKKITNKVIVLCKNGYRGFGHYEDYKGKQTWYNRLHTDSSEYKMWGNGISLPTALYVMQGIAEALKGGEG